MKDGKRGWSSRRGVLIAIKKIESVCKRDWRAIYEMACGGLQGLSMPMCELLSLGF